MDTCRQLKKQIALLDCILAHYEGEQHQRIRAALTDVESQRALLYRKLEVCAKLTLPSETR